MVFQLYKYYHSKTINIAVQDGCLKFIKLKFLVAIGDICKQTFKALTIQFIFNRLGLDIVISILFIKGVGTRVFSISTLALRSSLYITSINC